MEAICYIFVFLVVVGWMFEGVFDTIEKIINPYGYYEKKKKQEEFNRMIEDNDKEYEDLIKRLKNATAE